jgi:hypothetical protein
VPDGGAKEHKSPSNRRHPQGGSSGEVFAPAPRGRRACHTRAALARQGFARTSRACLGMNPRESGLRGRGARRRDHDARRRHASQCEFRIGHRQATRPAIFAVIWTTTPSAAGPANACAGPQPFSKCEIAVRFNGERSRRPWPVVLSSAFRGDREPSKASRSSLRSIRCRMGR